jgi:hypothetical protein
VAASRACMSSLVVSSDTRLDKALQLVSKFCGDLGDHVVVDGVLVHVAARGQPPGRLRVGSTHRPRR